MTTAAAGFGRAVAALDRRGSQPPLLFVHSTLPHSVWRFLPDGRSYPIEGVENLGLSSRGWVGPQWQVDQGFQRHVLQVQYTDRLVGALLDKLRARGLYDDAVIVLTADHGASFLKGTPRRLVSRENVGAIAPVPFFVKLPGPARGPRRRQRGADDRRPPDDREGGGGRAALEGGRNPGRRAPGRSRRADRRLARGRGPC